MSTPPTVWRHRPIPSGVRISKEDLERRQKALVQCPLFSDLPKRHVRSFAKMTGTSSHAEGAVIVKEGSSSWEFFAILEGRVKVVRGGRTVARLSPGDFFGEISLLDPGTRTATVIAEAPTQCLSLAGQDFREILAREPSLAMRILRELAKRLRERERPPAD